MEPDYSATVARLFDKCFEIVNDSQWKLPDVKNWFVEPVWKIEALENLKNDLNDVKSKLNDYKLGDWNTHTTRTNKAGHVLRTVISKVEPEFPTQAWTKFYENACSFPLVSEKSLAEKKLRSVHLCEAPGAFVISLNHWLKLNAPDVRWSWLATTLNPHYEGNAVHDMINDDRVIMHTQDNWYFGPDGRGNIMDLRNLDATVERIGEKATLVTADGSVSCLDTPAEQEQVVSQLLFCEIVAAMHLLETGGNLLVKAFTIFEHRTVCLMYLLCCCFDQVIVNKPVTSKEGNSEVYVVCLGFAGADVVAPCLETLRQNYSASPRDIAMFRRGDLPGSFVERIVACSAFFKEHQCEVILSNMRTYGSRIGADVFDMKRVVAEKFLVEYDLRPLPSKKSRLVGRAELFGFDKAMGECRVSLDSYNSRQREKRERENLGPRARLAEIMVHLDSIERPEDTWIELTLSDIPEKLSISVGKPYGKIRSSKFCAVTVMKMHIGVVDIADDVGFAGAVPSEDAIDEFVRENAAADRRVVNFGYANLPDNHGLIVKICDALRDLEKNQSLTLLGYSLLSRLNFGILYVLAGTFASLELRPSDEFGCVIDLKSYARVEKVDEFLRDILKASVEAERTGQALLTVLPLSTLCDPALYRRIVDINHWVIRHNARCVLAGLKG